MTIGRASLADFRRVRGVVVKRATSRDRSRSRMARPQGPDVPVAVPGDDSTKEETKGTGSGGEENGSKGVEGEKEGKEEGPPSIWRQALMVRYRDGQSCLSPPRRRVTQS